MDYSETDENFGGLDDRGTEFNFLSLHINTMTSMTMLGLTAIFIGLLLYCSSKECWGDIWRALKCCRCTMAPRHDQALYEPSTSLGSAYQHAALAPAPGQVENLRMPVTSGWLSRRNDPKSKGTRAMTSMKEKNVARGIIRMQRTL